LQPSIAKAHTVCRRLPFALRGVDVILRDRRRIVAAKKNASRKKAPAKGQAKVGKVMREYKQGELKSGGGVKVKSRKQAIAIALNEAREAGAKIAPPKKKSVSRAASSKKSAAKSTSSKTSAAKKS
jgi:Family of unknown function (DUF6496)